VILSLVGFFLLSTVGTGTLMYIQGKDDQVAYQNTVELKKANKALADAGKNNQIANKAGEDHATNVQVVHDTTREIVRTVTIPAESDPFLPVGFVRLFDRAASRSLAADPYPGKSDGEPSDIRVSQAATLLVSDWADKYYICKKQVDDTRSLAPVRPPPPQEERTLLERISPF
jgi:hypothetical protein